MALLADTIMRDENGSSCLYNYEILGRSLPIILEAVFTTLFNLSFSFTVIDSNHTVIENVSTFSIAAL